MQVFEEINTLLLKQIPFVCYVKPNESIWNLLVQQNDEIIEFSNQAGFVFPAQAPDLTIEVDEWPVAVVVSMITNLQLSTQPITS
jgi:hypothetical protein